MNCGNPRTNAHRKEIAVRRLRIFPVLIVLLISTSVLADDSLWSPRFSPPGVMKNDYVGTVYAIAYRDDDLYIAVKAGAQGTIRGRFERSVFLLEGAWGAGFDFPGPSPATYFVYTVEEYVAIGWANLQWPPSMTVTLPEDSEAAYGQVWIDGLTSLPGPTPGLRAQLGFGPDSTNPDGIW